MTERKQLRSTLRARRRNLSHAEREACARAMSRHLQRHPLFQRSQRIGMYLPADGEMDTDQLMRQAWRMGKTVYLPVLAPLRGNRLWFAPYSPGDPLVSNRFGIPEPATAQRRRVALRVLDLVLTPLVAFDAEGHRLGMGGGFYDRSFAFLRRTRHWHKPRLVGLAYAFQQVATLPAEPWDVPLQGIATENGISPCS